MNEKRNETREERVAYAVRLREERVARYEALRTGRVLRTETRRKVRVPLSRLTGGTR